MRVARVAGRQWGNVTLAQLKNCGLTSSSITRWTDKGVLHRRHRSVYAFGAPSEAPESRWAAALLAAGDGAHLCRITSLALFDLWPPPRVTDVTAATDRRDDETLRVHTTSRPEIVRRHGFLTTPLPRTFLDLAAQRFPIDRVVHEAAARRLVELADLREYAERRQGRPGAKILATSASNPHYRSMSEREFHAELAKRGVVAEPNAKVGGITVDLYLPGHRLALEVDFEQTHGTAQARRMDAERDARLGRMGIDVLRVDPSTSPP